MLCRLGAYDAANIRRSVLPLAVLLALCSSSSHAYELSRRLREAHELVAAESDLYGCLKRLSARGLVVSRWEQPTAGPPRKIYSVTSEGVEYVRLLIGAWSELKIAVESLVDLASLE